MTIDGPEVEAKVASVGDGRRRWAQLQAAPRLRDEKVSLVLKRLASRAGLTDPDRYSSHSTRRGFAAELRRHSTSDLEIAAAGGWQRLDQVRRYATSAAIWHDPPRPPGSGSSDGTVTDFDERREVRADRVLELARRGAAAGFHQLCLTDTIGVGTPTTST